MKKKKIFQRLVGFPCVGFQLKTLVPRYLDAVLPRVGAMLANDGLVTFMVKYEALRTLSESLLESLPQTILQVYIFLYCDGNEDQCLGLRRKQEQP